MINSGIQQSELPNEIQISIKDLMNRNNIQQNLTPEKQKDLQNFINLLITGDVTGVL